MTVIVEQIWTPITAESAPGVVIYLTCSSNIFFLFFLAFQLPSPRCPHFSCNTLQYTATLCARFCHTGAQPLCEADRLFLSHTRTALLIRDFDAGLIYMWDITRNWQINVCAKIRWYSCHSRLRGTHSCNIANACGTHCNTLQHPSFHCNTLCTPSRNIGNACGLGAKVRFSCAILWDGNNL